MENRTRRRLLLWGVLLIGVGTAAWLVKPAPLGPDAQREAIRLATEHPFTRHFQEYLGINTAQPAGNTKDAALFLQMVLFQEGIDAEIFESVPGKANLMAILPGGTGNEPPLILHHHMDTAPVTREDLWKYGPWDGTMFQGYLYGIGAIDMKSYGICFLEAFTRAHRERWTLRRPVIYLATCAEEADFEAGSKWILERFPERFPPGSVMLTEGGIVEMLTDQTRFVGIEVGQKAYARFQVAVPPDRRGALEADLQACIPSTPRVLPQVRQFLRDLMPFRVNFFRECMADVDRCVENKPYKQVYLPGPLKDLVFDTAYWVDFRTGMSYFFVSAIWGEPIEEYANRTAAVFRAHGIPYELFVTPTARITPSDSPAFSALAATYQSHFGVPVLPYLQSAALTESCLFREKGVLCYGIVPVRYNIYDAFNMNLFDERVFLVRTGSYMKGNLERLLRKYRGRIMTAEDYVSRYFPRRSMTSTDVTGTG